MESVFKCIRRFFPAALLILAQPVTAATISVTTDVDEFGTGTECSLREAVQSANDNSDYDNCNSTGTYGTDTIEVPADVGDGIYTLSLNGSEPLSGSNSINDLDARDLTTGNGLVIEGVATSGGAAALPGEIIIQPEDAGYSGEDARFFQNGDATTIRNLTVRGFAYSSESGGAIYAGDDLTLENVIFSANVADGGGGAIYQNQGSLVVRNSAFVDNVASLDGGAVDIQRNSATISDSTFIGNVAGLDGGFLNVAPVNTAPPASRLDNVTAVNNSADSSGGGLFVSADGDIQMRNTIIANNRSDISGPDCFLESGAGVAGNTDYNLIGDISDCGGFDTSNAVVGADPRLAARGRYDGATFLRPPLAGSAAIDSGSCTDTATLDISGDPDQRNGGQVHNVDGDGDGTAGCDIGAVERQKLPLRVDSYLDSRDQNPGDGTCQDGNGDCTLRAAIDEANADYDLDEIILDQGVYTLRRDGPPDNANDTGDLDVNSNVVVRGQGGIDTVLNANGLDRAFTQLSGAQRTTLALHDFNIIGGSVASDGGAIVATAEVRLTDMSVSGNETTSGTGNGYAALLLQGSANPQWANYRMVRSTLSGNTASGNYLIGASDHLWNNHIIDSTLSGNTASNDAAVLEGEDGNFAVTEITSSTFVDNSGGQLAAAPGSLITVHGSVVAGPTADDCVGSGTVVGTGANLEDDSSCGFANQNVAPQLAALADLGANVLLREPEAGSPLVDAGDCKAGNGRILPRAPFGTYRPQDADATGSGAGDGTHECDIGATERQQIRTALGPNNPAAQEVSAGDTDVVMAQIAVTNEAGQSVAMDNIGLLHLGSGSPDLDVSSVDIYYDNNDDGQLDGGDTLLGSDTYGAGETTINPALSGANNIASGTTANLLVVYDFNASLADASAPATTAMRVAGLGAITLLALLPFGRIFRRGVALVLILTAAGLSGCGGGGGGGAAAPAPQTADFSVRVQTLTIDDAAEGSMVTRTAGPNSNSVSVTE